MSRGSRVERSAEERELARQERARRRAEREGQAPPALEEQPPSFDASPPTDHAAGVDEHAADGGDVAPAQAVPVAAQPDPSPGMGVDAATQQWDVVSETEAADPDPAHDPPAAHFEPPAVPEAAPADAQPNAGPAGRHTPAAEPPHEPEPPVVHEPESPVVHEPESPVVHESQPPAVHEPELAAYELAQPGHEHELAAHESQQPAYEPELAAHEPEQPAHDPALPDALASDPHLLSPPADAPSTEELAAAELPAEEPPPAAPQPPTPRGTPSRGARREAAAGGDGGRLPPLPPAARSPLEPRRRSSGARIGAIVALLLVVVAAIVVLIVSSSSKGKSSSTSATPPTIQVVVPEGQTRLQIAQTASHLGLTGNYRTASKRSQLLDPTSYGAPSGTPDLEGFLFPATYDVYPHAPAARLVEDQLIAFKENFGAKEVARAKALHITPYQLLIVASMVEREAQVPGDRPKIAAVIYNRLQAGMPLGIDATLYYAIEIRENVPTYTRELTESQLQMSSRYNTRTHVGLPPTPIANPGMASIDAAGQPAHTSYLYYVLGADGCGEHVFSTSEAQFQTNAAAYQAAVRKNGGRPPTCKKR